MLVYIHSRTSSLLLLRYFIELQTFVLNFITQAVCTEPAAIAKQKNASETVYMLNQVCLLLSTGGVKSPKIRIFVALFSYEPATMSPNPDAAEEELPFSEGQIIKVCP